MHGDFVALIDYYNNIIVSVERNNFSLLIYKNAFSTNKCKYCM